MSWNDERVDLLKKMWGEGQSASQIAKELGGVTRNAVIGKVHEATAPAQRLLEREGFRYEGYVDIFDAGPTLQVPLSDIRTVRENRRVAVTAVAQELETPICLIARTDLNFRACLGPAMQTDDGVVLTSEVLDALQLGLEDSVRYIEL